jgi:AraC-like DNA-binding protein
MDAAPLTWTICRMAGPDLLRCPPRIALAGTYPFRPGEQIGRWWSASQHVVVVLDGDGVLSVAGASHPLRAGGTVAVPWGAVVGFTAGRRGLTIASLHLIALPWDAPDPGFPEHGPPDRQPPAPPAAVLPLPIARADPAGSRTMAEFALAAVRAGEDPPGAGRDLRLRGLALQVVAHLMAGEDPAAHTTGRVRDLMTWMRFNLDRPVTRADLARRAGLGQTALGAAFRRQTGQAPLVWFEALRLDEARRLLATTRLPIADIARRCGFADPAYFSRRFRRRFAAPPRRQRG